MLRPNSSQPLSTMGNMIRSVEFRPFKPNTYTANPYVRTDPTIIRQNVVPFRQS
jgi:hypothetical protein